MRNPGGYFIGVGPEGVVAEADSYSCKHCNRIVLVKPRCDPADVGGLCKVCMGLTCPECTAKGTCVTWEEQMKRIENRDRFLRQAGLV